uniref:Farnesol dehydrogenase n=1 Tax=Timema douglasi TaxID=61478 RepID=A0A7R8VNC3_TIMDO|nr:unnamed protein product [Timema douglasi]
MERWSGKVALVTGASVGIGAAIVEELVKHGLKVVGLARRVDKVEKLAASLKSAPGKLYAVKADVTKEEEIVAAFDWIKKNLGGVDILINNAGVGTSEPLIGKNISLIYVLLLRLQIPSIAGQYLPGSTSASMYPASKHAVTVLTEGLRRELVQLGSKIKVTVRLVTHNANIYISDNSWKNSVSPGVVETEFADIYGPDVKKFLYKENPVLQAKDIADAVLYTLGTPPHVQIHEITIRPIGEKF